MSRAGIKPTALGYLDNALTNRARQSGPISKFKKYIYERWISDRHLTFYSKEKINETIARIHNS